MSAKSRENVGGGPHTGAAYVLWEIDPDTLPERDCWGEVRRRIAAAERGADGWRTGEIATQISDFDGGDDGRA